MSTILTIFAGRRPNLEILTEYLKRALSTKIIDEIHFWNNTRNPSDEAYVRSISNIKRTSSRDSGTYIPLKTVIRDNAFSLSASATNDLHIKTVDDSNTEYEIVVGAWSNKYLLIRRNGQVLLKTLVPELLSDKHSNVFNVQIVHGCLQLLVNRELACSLQIGSDFNIGQVFVKTGHGSVGHLEYEQIENHGFYFMDTCEKSWKNYYEHYDHPRYNDSVILKCDDDIVFIDLQKLPKFVNYIRTADHDLVFANTINNGVSAFYQQSRYDLIPKSLMEFEYPNGGLEGSLWANGKKAEALHEYFIDNYKLFLEKDYNEDVIPIPTRFSINFFGYKGSKWAKIRNCFVDDERMLTVDFVRERGFQNVFYADMYVAHLSFYKQIETGIDLNKLWAKYRELCSTILGTVFSKVGQASEPASEPVFVERNKFIPEVFV